MPEPTSGGCGLGISFQRSGTRLCMDWINDNCDKECEPGITLPLNTTSKVKSFQTYRSTLVALPTKL